MTTRRRFIWLMPASGAALLAACSESAPPAPAAAPAAPAGGSAEYPVPAQPPVAEPAPAPATQTAPAPAPATPSQATGPMVAETDPTAVALSYVSDASRVDKAKHSRFESGQNCASCQLFQGAAGAASGPCPLFPGKQVAAAGWCASYVKKA